MPLGNTTRNAIVLEQPAESEVQVRLVEHLDVAVAERFVDGVAHGLAEAGRDQVIRAQLRDLQNIVEQPARAADADRALGAPASLEEHAERRPESLTPDRTG